MKTDNVPENGSISPETKTIPKENGIVLESQDKDVVSEGITSVSVYDQWVAPPVSGTPPKARYEVLALIFHVIHIQVNLISSLSRSKNILISCTAWSSSYR